jgi:hypothetical protein
LPLLKKTTGHLNRVVYAIGAISRQSVLHTRVKLAQ